MMAAVPSGPVPRPAPSHEPDCPSYPSSAAEHSIPEDCTPRIFWPGWSRITAPPPATFTDQSIRIRLRRDAYLVGSGVHRSGWPYAFRALQPLTAPEGILLEDFVERTFLYPCRGPRPVFEEPWIGIFHHPHGIPVGTWEQDRVQQLFSCPAFQRSRPALRCAVALSNYLAGFLAQCLQVPVLSLRHPTETPTLRFTPEAFLRNPDKQLVQVGWYLRNTRLIHQLPPLSGLRRVRAGITVESAQRYDCLIRRYWEKRGGRREHPGVTDLPHLSNAEYDRLLSRNVIVAEMFDASANNLVIECLVRHTPLIVNRHPAVMEYLGRDYPLFFERIEQIPELLQWDRLVRGSEYLAARDKTPLSGEFFRESLRQGLVRAARH